jgi:hypothetical protein
MAPFSPTSQIGREELIDLDITKDLPYHETDRKMLVAVLARRRNSEDMR